METRYSEVEFRPYDPANSDYSCADGELEGRCGGAAHGMDVEFTVDEGEVMAMHQGRAVIYHDGALRWAISDAGRHIAAGDMTVMAVTERPGSVAVIGDTVVTAGAGGLRYHRWTGTGYVSQGQLPPLPHIEFGLLKAGEMADTCSIVVPASMVPAQGGDGMSDTHPSADTTKSDDAPGAIDKIVSAIIGKAHGDKRGRGYFTSPFFVRYAVRDRSGACLCVSPPVLMAGAVLPPCMEVMYVAKTEKEATMRARLCHSGYFSLMARARALPPEWAAEIGGIDIYVSPQIATHASGAGYLCSYATVLGHTNGGGHRGRTGASASAGNDSTMFSGHYSDDGVSYIDHYTDAALAETGVWYVAPNVALAAEIAAEHRFYRVATISADSLAGMSTFRPVPVESTDTASLTELEELSDAPASAAICPEALATLNGRLVGAGGCREAVMPADTAVSAAFAGDASAAASTAVTVSVYTRDGGQLRRLSVAGQLTADIAGCFPRYVYHPDADAELMTLECGGKRYDLPLTRHAFLPGVYWFGGLGRDYLPEAATDAPPYAATGALIACADRVWVSADGSPRHFAMSRGIAACNSRIMAVCPSVVTPGVTATGRYPLYVFADDGVWLAEYDGDGMKGSCRVGGAVCRSGRSLAVTDDGVVFATRHSLMRVSGSNVRLLMPLERLTATPPPDLPGLPLPPAAGDGALTGTPVLGYDGAASSLIVADSDTGVAYIRDMATGSVSLWDRRVTALPLAPGRALVQTDRHEAGYLSPLSATAGAGVMVTRPIKLAKAFTPKRIHSVTVWHDSVPDAIGVMVYGANSLGSWHLIGSSACHRVEMASRSPWRFVRVAVAARAGSRLPEIYGAQIEWSDY